MANPDKSIDPRILKSAEEEFLLHGYKNASLKTICEKAGVTTGALYKRYKGKEELFGALVQPTINDLNEIIESRRIIKPNDVSDERLITVWDMDADYTLWWFKFLFERYNKMVLLLKSSDASSYSNFNHEWVNIITKSTYEYYIEAYNRGLTKRKISKKEIHVLLSAFWTTIYEPFIHSFTWEEIVHHCSIICNLFDWYKVLGFTE